MLGSVTYRLSDASTDTPCGALTPVTVRVVCDPPPGLTLTIWLLPVSATYPASAASTALPRGWLYPVPYGTAVPPPDGYWVTALSVATYTLNAASTATPCGLVNPDAIVVCSPRFDNSTTSPLVASATYRSPLEATATPRALPKPLT